MSNKKKNIKQIYAHIDYTALNNYIFKEYLMTWENIINYKYSSERYSIKTIL